MDQPQKIIQRRRSKRLSSVSATAQKITERRRSKRLSLSESNTSQEIIISLSEENENSLASANDSPIEIVLPNENTSPIESSVSSESNVDPIYEKYMS